MEFMKHLRNIIGFFALFAMLSLSSDAMAQKAADAKVKAIRQAYAKAQEKIKAGEEDANLNNKAVIVVNQNFPGSGPSQFTVEYFFTTKEHPKSETMEERVLYFMRVKQLWAETPSYFEYLFDEKGEDLIFYYSKIPNTTTDGFTEVRDYFGKEKQEPFLEIVDGTSYKKPKNDSWLFVIRFLASYKDLFNILPPFFDN